MNYAHHYKKLIARARDRVLKGYSERHHVIPKCMGGGNESWNLVELTAEEHYVAHQLLCRMHPTNSLLIYGAVSMAKRCSGNKAYGWLRRRNALARSTAMMGNNRRGGPRSLEWREKIGAAHRGKTLSAEHRAKLSMSHRGHKPSPETLVKMALSQRGTKRPPRSLEWCAKQSVSQRARWAEIKAKVTT